MNGNLKSNIPYGDSEPWLVKLLVDEKFASSAIGQLWT